MSSLKKHFDTLIQDLMAEPMRISAYHDLPFTIFVYPPKKEFECRNLLRLASSRMEQEQRKKVHFLSLARLLWKIIDETEGQAAIENEEKQFGFDRVQQTLHQLISDPDFLPITQLIEEELQHLNPCQDVIFMVRTAALAPDIYRASTLLDQLHGKTAVPIVLFYPGTIDSRTDLRFMGLQDRAGMGAYNYRVKIYGGL